MIRIKEEIYSFFAVLYVFVSLIGYQLVTSVFLPLTSDMEVASSVVTYPFRIGVFLLAFILIFTTPKTKQPAPDSKRYMVTFYVVFMLIYFLRILIDIFIRQVFVVPEWRSTTLQYMFVVVLPALAAMSRCSRYIDHKRLGRWLMWGSIAFLLLLIINQSTLLRLEYEEMTRGRGNVAMGSLNLGYSCVLIFIVLLCSVLEKDHRRVWNPFLYFFMFLSFVVMLRAASRGPLVCWTIMALFFLFSRTKNKVLAVVVSAIAILLIWSNLSGIIDWLGDISPLMEKRMESTLNEGNVSGRDKIYAQAFALFSQSPILGSQFVMPGGFYCHNSLFDVMIGLGLFGALAWLFIIIKDVIVASKCIKDNTVSLMIAFLSVFYIVESFFSGAMYISAKLVVCIITVFSLRRDNKSLQDSLSQ